MSVASFSIPHLPPDLRVHLAIYTNVRNASYIRSQILAGNTTFEYAFIDATTILSITHLLAAIFRACNDYQNHRLRTRNVHSEIVYCLGYTNNIAATLKTFGLMDDTTEMIAVKVSCPSWDLNADSSIENVQRHLLEVVEGELVPQAEGMLGRMADVSKIRKICKLGVQEKTGKGRRRKDGSLEGGKVAKDAVDGKQDPVSRDDMASEDDKRTKDDLEMQILGLMAIRGAL